MSIGDTGLFCVVLPHFSALLLLQEHRAHLWGMALYLILILCPLMFFVLYREG
ncbi:DUF2933 domain-containing protein [Methylophaga nitratireducenticrescens]|uniref:DUF2933 domain-containing protein n=1 Tax=Methylophaga nitratireducenticrescens TaxID=754476 RepID=UPI000CDCD529|nr:hypothetical protein CDW43_08720 [Methylophaga nitratireducenticrescens]